MKILSKVHFSTGWQRKILWKRFAICSLEILNFKRSRQGQDTKNLWDFKSLKFLIHD